MGVSRFNCLYINIAPVCKTKAKSLVQSSWKTACVRTCIHLGIQETSECTVLKSTATKKTPEYHKQQCNLENTIYEHRSGP